MPRGTFDVSVLRTWNSRFSTTLSSVKHFLSVNIHLVFHQPLNGPRTKKITTELLEETKIVKVLTQIKEKKFKDKEVNDQAKIVLSTLKDISEAKQPFKKSSNNKIKRI